MNCKQICSLLFKGLLFGGVFLVSLLIVTSFSKNQSPKTVICYNETVEHFPSSDIEEANIADNQLNQLDTDEKFLQIEEEVQKVESPDQGKSLNIPLTISDNQPPVVYLIQILFWLFLISPPIIVILLFVIIRKMDEKK